MAAGKLPRGPKTAPRLLQVITGPPKDGPERPTSFHDLRGNAFSPFTADRLVKPQDDREMA